MWKEIRIHKGAVLCLLVVMCLRAASAQNGFFAGISPQQTNRRCTSIQRCGDNTQFCFNDARQRRLCECKPGFRNDSPGAISFLKCTDINECGRGITICGANTYCNNTLGSYECRCNRGFGNIRLLGNRWTCSELNECGAAQLNQCGDGTTCENLVGSYRCGCLPGYSANGMVNGKYTCSLASPCSRQQNTQCGVGTTCQIRNGIPSCVCFVGHTDLRVLPGVRRVSVCRDVDECLVPGTCGANSRCENTMGSYTCISTVPQALEPLPDVDECARFGVPACPTTQKCINTIGSFQCIPLNGQTVGADGIVRDYNECNVPNICQPTETCVNLRGTYRCDSRPGFQNGRDIDECLLAPTSQPRCPNGDKCINTIGSFRCIPADGGTRDLSGRYLDIDECQFPGICAATERCENTRGSYTCIAQPGLANGEDVNECLNTPSPCGLTQRCINTVGSYRCLPREGQTVDNQGVPQDVDECAIGGICPVNHRCRNTPGSYECLANNGFDVNGQDLNECLTNTVCNVNERCINTIGSYQCVSLQGCIQGATGRCRDIDECSFAGICLASEICVNSIGSYQCQPQVGFTNGIDIDECQVAGICPSLNTECKNTIGSYACIPRGRGVNGEPDFNECEIFGICGSGRTCENTVGSYRCLSPLVNGIESGVQQDVNECLTPNVCPGEVCINTVGSFQCIPSTGGRVGVNSQFEDINECNILNAIPCGLRSQCINSIGSYRCQCEEGFVSRTGDGRSCEPFGSNGRNGVFGLGAVSASSDDTQKIGIGVGVGVVCLAVIAIIIVIVVVRRSGDPNDRAHTESSSFNFQEVENPSNRPATSETTSDNQPVISTSPDPVIGEDPSPTGKQPGARRSLLEELYKNYNIPRAGNSTDPGTIYSNDQVKASKAAARAEK